MSSATADATSELPRREGAAAACGDAATLGLAAHDGARPFARCGAPDVTGHFLGDTPGIEAVATLRLVPAPAAQGPTAFPRSPGSRLQALERQPDSRRGMNPGSLGLARPAG